MELESGLASRVATNATLAALIDDSLPLVFPLELHVLNITAPLTDRNLMPVELFRISLATAHAFVALPTR